MCQKVLQGIGHVYGNVSRDNPNLCYLQTRTQSSTPDSPPPTVPRDSPSTCPTELEASTESLDMTLSMWVKPTKQTKYQHQLNKTLVFKLPPFSLNFRRVVLRQSHWYGAAPSCWKSIHKDQCCSFLFDMYNNYWISDFIIHKILSIL